MTLKRTIAVAPGVEPRDEDLTAEEESQLVVQWEAVEEHKKTILYRQQRMKDYPSIVDQLDDLYHLGYDGWKSRIKVIKDKYPKPTE